jgi:serine phosphatase RsbU (regulator of sigma subunit)
MKEKLSITWNRISRVGLRDEEGVLEFREVIFLNRVLALIPMVMLFYIPLELYFNGTAMIHVVFIMIFFFLIPFPLHYYRLFKVAKYYLLFVGNIFIISAGLMVGKGINNHVTLIPIVLMVVILFKTPAERFIGFLITVGFFVLQHYLFDIVPPQIPATPELKAIFAFIFFLLAMVISYFVGTYFVGINKEYEKIVIDQKEVLSLKNKEITDSITYAKRIQNAILPSDKVIRESLPDSFVLYKPKDIVAGDFYWLEKNDTTVLFAAADSTGHGVPGAMVSVVCKNALSRSVREFKLNEPGRILDKSREIIIQEFEKSETEVQDGMDISLCSFSTKTYELQWAGANNPLLIIRNKEIIEIKPDKQPVGKFAASKEFTTHKFQLLKGDLLYVFTDGYSDQFGGPNKKKLKYKAFKQLLLDNHLSPMAVQKEKLDRAIELWKGPLEQVDDICLIGVCI